MADTYQDIRVDREGVIAIITINRPAKLNAVTVHSIDEIEAALDQMDRDDGVRAVIMTGEGRAFCAGADISGGFEVPKTGDPSTGEGIQSDPGGRVALRLFRMQKPVIAAVNGPAVGFGSSVLLPMDYRIASTTAKFAFPFVKRAIVAESCSSWFLPRLVGIATALSWMISGRTFLAEEAKAAGMIQEIVEPDALMERARTVAHSFIAETSSSSVGLVRRLLWTMLGQDHPMQAHRLESRGLVAAYRGPDYEEGFKSFLEKRPPQFSSAPSRDLAFANSWWAEPGFEEE
ncbi:enoyl-CoA hydratase-related protein [Aminobacter sp. LjRoot7]|uniref:enoyl-CoA hydratase-related protein n=1 Tax=Aminobacter sp. LjRoot7 TaxID=3342335 RepID=UPI003ECE8ACC